MQRKLFVISFFTMACANAQVDELQSIMACHTTAETPGLAVWIEQSGKRIFSKSAGLANVETKTPLEVNHVFQIGSVTKQFTAAAILKLEEQGKLSLESKLGDFIQALPANYAALTLRRVLSHTSGLPNYNTDAVIRSKWDKYAPLDQIVETVSQQPIELKSGEQYQYSNTGYVLLGKVIEVVSGVSFAEYMQKEIFTPLSMTNTYVIVNGEQAGQVVGYTASRENPNLYIAPELVDRSWIYAAGAIASTLEDMSRWHNALKSGKLVSRNSYQKMVIPAKLNNGTTVNYGLGFDVYPISNHVTYSHQGGVPGFMTWSVYFPEKDLFATAFSNNDTQHPGPALLDMIARQLHLSPHPLDDKKSKNFADKLVGTYVTKDKEKMTITFNDHDLYASLDDGEKRKLVARENDSFSYQCTENYFKLIEHNGKYQIIPVSIYRGESEPFIKLEI